MGVSVASLLIESTDSMMASMTILLLCSTNLGAVTLSPPERAPVCSGGQLELTCTTTGSHLEWRFSVILENETTATDVSRIFASSDSASDATMPPLIVNSTVFNFSRTSARNSLPVESRLLIGPVSDGLNGTVMSCDDLESSESSSTAIIIVKRDPLLEKIIIVRERHEFEDDGVPVILEWEELNPLYSLNVTVTPETQVNISSGRARLIVAYNSIYNVTIVVSHFCDQSSEMIFSELYYYPRGTAHTNASVPHIICGNPEAQIANSVIISGYTTPAVEGTTVTFQCIPGLVLNGINSSMCMENGEWEPALYGVYCSDGLISGLSGDLKIAISTSITAFVIGSILFFIIGFLCRHLYQTETVREIQGPTYYHNKPEQEIELKENVAYGPIQA